MGIQVNGGAGGNGSIAVAAKGVSQQTLFTTPATANTLFIVTVNWAVAWSGTGFPIIGTIGQGIAYSASGPSNSLIIKAGPSTPINVTWGEMGNQVGGTVYYSYSYVSILVDL
jgi:hypothetical protein